MNDYALQRPSVFPVLVGVIAFFVSLALLGIIGVHNGYALIVVSLFASIGAKVVMRKYFVRKSYHLE